ncbi:cytochrome c1 [Paracandidimonas soli]|nr:cytochrome c1 [Paracandidimonas soli]
MIMMKKLLGALALFLTCTVSFAAGGTYPLEKAPNRINDMAALQNGAKLFVNYCLNCHSANSLRYNKLTEIGLTEEEIKKNLLFTSDKVGDLMHIAMTPADAKSWFGTTPPDLSVIARARSVNLGPSGVDYLYTYLRTFYRDSAKGTGWNNLVFPDVGMPHVMWQRQGERTLTKTQVHQAADQQWERVTTVYDADGFSEVTREALSDYKGKATEEFKFEAANAQAAAQFDSDMADLSNFLGWMAEPVQQLRKQIGVWVLLFLGLFLLVAWRLNAAYWKHVR